MAIQGGSVFEVNIGGRPFQVASGADLGMKLGGRENETRVSGGSLPYVIQESMPGKISSIEVLIDHDLGDFEYLQSVSDSPELTDVSATYADGSTYGGRGTINGEVSYSAANATASFELGTGRLDRIN